MIHGACEPGLNMCKHMCQANTLNLEPIIIMQANASKLTDTGLTVLVVNNIIGKQYYIWFHPEVILENPALY